MPASLLTDRHSGPERNAEPEAERFEDELLRYPLSLACGRPKLGSTAVNIRLDGKTALVTGAGRGIGRAIALALAAAGAELVLVSRTKSQFDEVAREIASGGGKAQVLPFDVTDTAAVRTAFAGLGRLDILVNNAGLNRPQPFSKSTRRPSTCCSASMSGRRFWWHRRRHG